MRSEPVSSDSTWDISPNEIVEDRYSRLRSIHWWDQERLAQATALVVGAGALGNEIVKNLALLGVGRVHVVDLDRMESSNLSRSVLFRAGDEGLPKADLVARRAMEVNPDCTVVPWVGDVCRDVGLGVFRDVDAVIAGLDNREARLFINQACWKTGTPWIDGGIEVLVGVARVFIPGHGACYECTMSDVDYELLNKRRSCALLGRADLDAGHIPTTPTTASVIAGIEVQEFVKLLHADRGLPTLAGKGFVFNGLTHDSYVVEYTPRDDCLSHDSYENIEALDLTAGSCTVGQALDWVAASLGPRAQLELEREIITGLECVRCQETTAGIHHLGSFTEDRARCPSCGEVRKPLTIHTLGRDQGFDSLTLREVGVPDYDIITGRTGMDRIHALLAGDRDRVMSGQRQRPETAGGPR
jgi:adenylyltransferase/sulfurtransferase